jgi:hypothetical protein
MIEVSDEGKEKVEGQSEVDIGQQSEEPASMYAYKYRVSVCLLDGLYREEIKRRACQT